MTAMPATQTRTRAISTVPPITKVVRYVEWLSLGIPALRMLFPILYRPFGHEVGIGDFLVFGVLALFTLLSLEFPAGRPLWQRRVYVWVEVAALLATRLYSPWGFDLLLWLVLIKVWFLFSRREAIFITIVSGVLWQMAIAQYFVEELRQPDDIAAQLEVLQNVPIAAQLFDIVLNTTTVHVVANAMIMLLCLTILSERKSRQREAALAQEVELLAADLERTRIARDIHDSLGHTLMSLDVQIELAQRLHERGAEVGQVLATSKQLASQSIREVRRSVATMRQEAFDLSAALRQLLEPLRTDPALVIRSDIDLPKLPLQTSHQLYCIIKEGLENIQRHSRATVVYLHGRASPDGVTLHLSDNGVGMDLSQPTSGFGLQGIRERSQLIGADVAIHSAPGQGTTIQVTVPQ